MIPHPDPLAELSAGELVELFRRGQASPVDAARAALERIHRYNDRVNAFCLVDETTTLKQARAAEQRYRNGAPLGPLDGVAVAVKDVFLTRGWPTLKGSRTINPQQPWRVDAPAVVALKRAGCVLVGKTTTPEFGWKGVTDSTQYAVTRNPWLPACTAGGSSGGSGAALPLGMAPLALGTDAGGSIRIPAGFCGTVGFKPSYGEVPHWPPPPYGLLAHAGPMSRTVEDCARLLNVLVAFDARDPNAAKRSDIDYLQGLREGIAGLRIAFSPNLGYVQVEADIAAAVARAAAVFESLGAIVEQRDPGFADPREAFEVLFYSGAYNAVRTLKPSARALLDPALDEVARMAERWSLADYLDAMNQRHALTQRLGIFHLDYDLLLTPTLPIPAFSAGREVPEGWPEPRWHTWTPFTYPFNLTGQPALSVPCGFTSAGLPIGLQIVGARYADALVLRAGHAYQQAASLTERRPELLSD